MDTLVSSPTATSLIEVAENARSGEIFRLNRIGRTGVVKFHPKACLVRKEDFWNIGGYDEDFCGNYGYDDLAFWHRAKGKVCVRNKKNIYVKLLGSGAAPLPRSKGANAHLFKEKRNNNNWSTDAVRFKWTKEMGN